MCGPWQNISHGPQKGIMSLESEKTKLTESKNDGEFVWTVETWTEDEGAQFDWLSLKTEDGEYLGGASLNVARCYGATLDPSNSSRWDDVLEDAPNPYPVPDKILDWAEDAERI